MTNVTPPSNTQNEPSPLEIKECLKTLLFSIPKWSDQRVFVEKNQRLLLTDFADGLLTTMLKDIEQSDDPRVEDLGRIVVIFRTIFRRARKIGLSEAWTEVEKALTEPEPSFTFKLTTKNGTELFGLFLNLLKESNYQSRRHFLETHPELLTQECDDALSQALSIIVEQTELIRLSSGRLPNQAGELIYELKIYLALLRDARKRGGSIQAIKEAYVNEFGGFALDLPAYLGDDVIKNEDDIAPEQLIQHANMLRKSIVQAQSDADLAPELLAELHKSLGNTLMHEFQSDSDASRLPEAITAYQKALQVYTFAHYPNQYAGIQNNLGLAYAYVTEGELQVNQERAIACYNEALRVYTKEDFSVMYAQIQMNLGNIYHERIKGEQRANQEQAIVYLQNALQIYAHGAFPVEYAKTLQNLGNIYGKRLEGIQQVNLERAIACYEAALQVFTQAAFPANYAKIQGNLGVAHVHVTQEREKHFEQAIACYKAALDFYTRDRSPFEYARLQNHLGLAYRDRPAGDPEENRELAIACHKAALEACPRALSPQLWAHIQHNLGNAYLLRLKGLREDNLQQAVTCYKAALEVKTLERVPEEHRQTQFNLGYAEAERHNWAASHEAYTQAQIAEDLLLRLGVGTIGRDVILKFGRDAVNRHGFVLTRMGQVEAAARVLEQGRARGLAEALAFDAADPAQIQDAERRKRYISTRQTFINAQQQLHAEFSPYLADREQRNIAMARTEAYQKARDAFDAIIEEIRAAQDPAHFLQDTVDADTLLRAASIAGAGHALVYLVATSLGGVAVAVMSASAEISTSPRFASFDLPGLTDEFVNNHIQNNLQEEVWQATQGFTFVQEGQGFTALLKRWQSTSFQELAQSIREFCDATDRFSTLNMAAQAMLASPCAQIPQALEQPLSAMSKTQADLLTSNLTQFFLQAELARCLKDLSLTVAQPLIAWLRDQGVGSLTFIPCGWLAIFPFTSTLLESGQTVGETLPTSVAPSARSLLHDIHIPTIRAGVYAIGNPHPTHQELEWGEAEAHTVTKLARNLGLPADTRVHHQATRDWVVQALQLGSVVDASCHGSFNIDTPLESALILAEGQRLRLGDMLSHEVDLHGLRLLILSACETAILDLQGARDEVHSMAAGMLQAGARAVIAALWSVDDQATYLLMVRFAQEWFPHIGKEPPAAALARAQHWLRTVTNSELQQWHNDSFLVPTVDARRRAGSEHPELDPWHKKLDPANIQLSNVTNTRSARYAMSLAEQFVRVLAGGQDNPDQRPYQDPIYWASFQVIGW